MKLDTECDTCSEPGSGIEGECPMSKRSCGHHCNCVWIHDVCHWCKAEVNEDGEFIPNYAPVERVSVPPSRSTPTRSRSDPKETPQ